ncbi:hypothetical protein PIB30_111820, partial [Stylosanthes scabra]|nr:hypothetical protein [Stylosanthes scabra]
DVDQRSLVLGTLEELLSLKQNPNGRDQNPPCCRTIEPKDDLEGVAPLSMMLLLTSWWVFLLEALFGDFNRLESKEILQGFRIYKNFVVGIEGLRGMRGLVE